MASSVDVDLLPLSVARWSRKEENYYTNPIEYVRSMYYGLKCWQNIIDQPVICNTSMV